MTRGAVLILAGLALAGCSSFSDWTSSMSTGSTGGAPVKLESDPPGAEARTSVGPGCQTPCTVVVPGRDDFTVTFALAGYQARTIPVGLQRQSGGFGDMFSAAQFAPNPVFARLEPAPPEPVKKKKPRPKPRTATRTAPTSGSGQGSGTPPAAADVPASQRTIPGAQPTAPPAAAWPPPQR